MNDSLFNVLAALIDAQDVCFISSVDEAGFPNTKAMFAPSEREGLKYFYFSTNTSSMRVKQFRGNPRACLYFCDRPVFKGVMLKGTMEVLEDAAVKKRLWREGDEQYYPLGVADPDYCFLRFTAASGRLYTNLESENFDIA